MENYKVIENIGKGSFGVVTKIQRISDGKILVWKELNYGKMSEREKQQLVAEVNILRELKHPNIVRYYDRIIDKKETKIYIIMEYCEGGDMGSLLKKCKRDKDYIAEDVIWKIFTQIILALNECHNRKKCKILHRDLKPANIFLDHQNNIKLGDFGLAKLMGEESVFAQTHVGTPYYMSPEQINESKYNEKSDIWSSGCLLYEMTALKPPFEAKNHLQLAFKIKSGKFDRIPIKYSEDLNNLIKSMLTIDPEQRPSVSQLLNIPQIKLRLKERKLREKHQELKVKEEELKKREDAIKLMEQQLSQKEEDIKTLQKKINDQEINVAKLEQEVSSNASSNNSTVNNQQQQQQNVEQLLQQQQKNNNNIITTSVKNLSRKQFDFGGGYSIDTNDAQFQQQQDVQAAIDAKIVGEDNNKDFRSTNVTTGTTTSSSNNPSANNSLNNDSNYNKIMQKKGFTNTTNFLPKTPLNYALKTQQISKKNLYDITNIFNNGIVNNN